MFILYCTSVAAKLSQEAHPRRGANGVNVWVETLIQYLLCDKSDAERPNFEGAKFVMSPPLPAKNPIRTSSGTVCARASISTSLPPTTPRFDFATQKQMGRGDFTKIPNGIPLPGRLHKLILYTRRQTRPPRPPPIRQRRQRPGRQTFRSLPAQRRHAARRRRRPRRYGDPAYRGKISAATHHMNLDYNAFEDCQIEGRPHVVTVRGKVASDGREILSDNPTAENSSTRTHSLVGRHPLCGASLVLRRLVAPRHYRGSQISRHTFYVRGARPSRSHCQRPAGESYSTTILLNRH